VVEAEDAEETPKPEADLVEPEITEDVIEEEPAQSFEEIFSVQPEMIDIDEVEEDDEEEETDRTKKRAPKKKRKTQKKYVDVEYDPEADVTLYRKRRKGDSDEWEDDVWEY
jgi:hypothetical protein